MKMTSKKQFATLFMLFVICVAITAHAASPEKGPAPVRVKNTPDVNVVNGPDEPVPVISVGPTPQPFQILLPDTAFTPTGLQVAFTVPSDKRMVIELITIQGEIPSTMQLQLLDVATTVANPLNNNAVVHRLKIPNAVPQIATPNSLLFQADYSLRLYADPGTVVRFFAFAGSTGTFGNGFAQISVSGYLVPLNSPSLAP